MKSTQIGKDRKGEFAELLEQSLKKQGTIDTGAFEMVTVTDVTNKDFVFVSTSRGTGLIAREELIDGDNKIRVSRGEKIPAFFRSSENGELFFTTVPAGRARAEILKAALENQIPLRGRVARKIKGGFEVTLGEVTAFCPGSQMDSSAEAKAELMFIVTEARGERVVVSNRIFRDTEKKRQKEMLMKSVQAGDVVDGTVANVTDFGAFVDIGGLEGLVPVSELSHQRPAHPSQVVKSGQQVRVKILQIDWKEDKLTLSIRALLDNPWQGKLPFNEGEILQGKVDSVKTFGVFVKLPGNFTGLIPAAETGVPRGQVLDKHFHKNQEVRVLIAGIDREKEKISLSVREVANRDQQAEFAEYMRGQEPEKEEMSSFGRALMESLKKKQ